MLRIINIMLLVLLAVAATAFALQNTSTVALDLFFTQVEEASVGAIALGSFALGGLFGLLAGSAVWFRLKRAERAAKRKLVQSEKELDSLRSNVA
ncbi:MAG: lipopolysaccharide assembly protein LapA domain-containing protein [Pseudomonadota bacterium]